MKWINLFYELKKFLLYEPNIDLSTSKRLIKIFTNSFSITNYNKFQTEIDYLLSFTSIQLSIQNNLKKLKIQKIEKEFNKLKNGDKNKLK